MRGAARAIMATLLVAVALGPTGGSAQQEGTLQKIVRTKKFNMGYTLQAPEAAKDPKTGELTGFHFGLARWICDQMKVECVFHEATWATFIAGLQSGQYDLSIAGSFATIPRAMAVAFTEPLYYKSSTVVAQKSSPIKSIADLNKPGVKVVVVQGTYDHTWAERNLPQAQLIVSSAEPNVALLDVVAGRADAALTDSGVARLMTEKYPQLRDVLGENPYTTHQVAWAVRYQDEDLLRFMNVAIQRAQAEGVILDLERKIGVTKTHWHPVLRFAPGE
jgi:polar amino acid transport system substrate-binding protein